MSGRVLCTSLRSINSSHSISSAKLKFRPSAFMWEVSIFVISIFKKQRKTDNRMFYQFLSIFDHVTSQVSGARPQERYFIFTFTFLGFCCCFLSFSSLLWWSVEYRQHDINQSQTGISDKKLWVEICAYIVALFSMQNSSKYTYPYLAYSRL